MDESDIKILKNIPIPEPGKKGQWTKYPFIKLEVGDCMEVPFDRITQQSIYSALKNFRIKNFKRKFTIRASKHENWIRVWRIE